MTNLKAILHPAYEPGDGKADGAQLVDGEWWHPIFGCDSLQKVVDNARSMLQLPPGYIDPEHQGQDRELLQAFYHACRGEGGTADEIHLRGIKAALARHGCTALQPQQEGVEPTDAGLDALERKHWKLDSVVEYEPGLGCREVLERQETFDHRAFARTVLARYGRPTFQPIPVSERLPGPDDCCPNPRTGLGRWCWGWVQRDPIPYSGCWRMMRWDWLSAEALAWAPWWAFPVPGATEMVGEGQPCSP